MTFFENTVKVRLFILFTSVVVIGIVVWNISVFYEGVKEEEREKMRIWSSAQASVNRAGVEQDLSLELEILNTINDIPMFIVNESDDFQETNNISDPIATDSLRLRQFFESIKAQNQPIVIDLGASGKQYLYYGDSSILTKIKYYPFILLLIIFLLIGLIYLYYITAKNSEKNKLWAGMAKETAHQIGTPLSSLVGWMEILRSEAVNPEYILEIEKDIDRLKTITERFSKVGSKLTLEVSSLRAAVEQSYNYLRDRSSKLIQFSIELPADEFHCKLNPTLLSWTIENLTKNAIDAMKGRGSLNIRLFADKHFYKIHISDTGKGIPGSKFKTIFQPGYSTKKRGWGLGLSLSKRIIEDYHSGKIRVLSSSAEAGTIFEIKLPKT
ncbi:HAMP domain-containing histidine kinase [Psychroflexus sp. YR1-1]|uniref:histidine kinase n=1 Tax=Psychroflexus aurantiacus TaxID=2709310 RepID=A0A6B3QYS1_9FLAO|nr:HAMP domain-containing sensor histidine kinase [Psychroflexus aurantiacus]NEV93299.1 HAMP domain-containing histidine kinase [Psychroflexus aurantiacus]